MEKLPDLESTQQIWKIHSLLLLHSNMPSIRRNRRFTVSDVIEQRKYLSRYRCWKSIEKKFKSFDFTRALPFPLDLRLFRCYCRCRCCCCGSTITFHLNWNSSGCLSIVTVESLLAASLWLAQNQMSTEVNMMKRRSSSEYANDVAWHSSNKMRLQQKQQQQQQQPLQYRQPFGIGNNFSYFLASCFTMMFASLIKTTW